MIALFFLHVRNTFQTVSTHPIAVGIVGSTAGWMSVDFLRAAQIFAALMAGLVSLCSLIIVLPKAWAIVNRGVSKIANWIVNREDDAS